MIFNFICFPSGRWRISASPAGPGAVAIGINAFLALRKPEVEALLPDDYDKGRGRIRIHRDTKTGNDEWLPVVAPLAKLLSDGWEQINLRRAEYEIRSRALIWRRGVGMPSAVG